MSVLNLSEDMVECPLCMEPLEMDDLNFFPCTCGYQICRFCWHRIRTDENGLCPACRKAYPENPADFKPLSPEELARIKQEKRQKDAQRKQKVTENRKHLANVRVVQKNLVFVVGLSTRLADAETLRKPDYFGKFGKIHKVVINHTTSYAGSQGPSASAYVTYQRAEDALRAIQAVNNIHVDGRTLKASLGTTKYCSHFMKNQQCPKPDCMYLHELGDEAASFTKEEMQQGKHQEFEKKLQDQYLGTGAITPDKNGCSNAVCNNISSSSISNSSSTNSISNGTSALTVCSSSHKRSISAGGKENSAPKSLTGCSGEVGCSSGSGVREAWPSLGAPPSTKENKKSKGSKSDRNSSSSRHSPTEEHNNNKRETRGSKERERLGHSMSGSCNSVNSNNGSTSSNTNGSSILSSSVGDSGDRLRGLSPVGHNSPVSSQDSCTSSASTTPPPPCTDLHHLHTPPSPPPSDHTSPLPVTTGIDIHNPHNHHHHRHHHHHHHHHPSSPLTTPPSSLSSSSEPSSSLPLPQGFPSHHSATPTGAPQPTPASSSSSLFSDNSNSFFSSGPSLPLQRHNSPPTSSPTPPTHQQQLHQVLTNNSHQHSEDINSTTDWGSKSSEIFSMDSLLSQNRSNSTWNCIFDMDKNEEIPGMNNLVDDELGFDPFEETNKALAEDIKIEQKQQEQQRTQHFHQQQFQQQNHHNQQHHQQQIQQQQHQQITQQHLRSGLKNLMDGFSNPSSGVASRTRLPPPGFNGLSSFNNFPSGSTSAGSSVGNGTQQEGNKLPGLPQYLGGLNSTPPGLAAAAVAAVAQGNTLRNNTLNGLNGLSVPPGLGGSLLGGTNSLNPGGLGGNPPPHLLTPASILGMDTTLGGAGPPPGLGLPPKADAFLLKDLENGLRNIFPAISSVSTMNTLNTVNTINSMVATTQNNQQSQQNPLTNFLNMAQQQQQHQQQQQQQQQQQHSTQQSLLQQLTMNSLANAHKGWSSSGGAPDLTALDPAIVSSGQLTDSRSDSPPHWMKTMEHITNDGQPTQPPLWNNLLPYNLPAATPPTMAPHTGGNISVGGRGNSGNMWPPTSPPPGFNSISPLHLPKHQQTHKIENL